MTYRLTRASARAAGSCYSDARLAELVPPDGLSPAEVAELDIPLEDRVWALICACGAPQEISAVFARMCEDRAAAAVVSADRVFGLALDDVAVDVGRAASAASTASYTATAYARDVHALGHIRAARSAAFGAAVAAARAAAALVEVYAADATSASAFGGSISIRPTAASILAPADAGRLLERLWQINTLVELLSHNHPQIEGDCEIPLARRLAPAILTFMMAPQFGAEGDTL
jgi:hypothetical protein